jgi:hypothetical protein
MRWCSGPRLCFSPRRAGITSVSHTSWDWPAEPSASGGSGSFSNDWTVFSIVPDRDAPGLFPPQVEAEVKAVACALPKELGLPLSRLSSGDIYRAMLERGFLFGPSVSTIWRWLKNDPLKPWQYRMWIFSTAPQFRAKAERVLNLYFGFWEGEPLSPDDYVISADEKTSIQARARKYVLPLLGPHQVRRIEFEYERKGALAYMAAWDVHRGKPFGLCREKTGIESFHALVDLVMQQEPYRSARRVFWITDNGSSHRGESSQIRLSEWYPNAVQVHTPVHASWLNQVELYLSIVQRKALTPNTFESLADLEQHLMDFQTYYAAYAEPFNWRFTKKDLHRVLDKIVTPKLSGKFAA